MSYTEELVEEIKRVQKEIDRANTLTKTPPTHFAADLTKDLQAHREVYTAKVAQDLSKALKSGRMDEIITGGLVLGAALVGAYAIDGINGMIAAGKAKKILLACYEELAVKQHMLIEEQQRLIEKVDAENSRLDSEVQKDKERIKTLAAAIKRINELLVNRSV